MSGFINEERSPVGCSAAGRSSGNPATARKAEEKQRKDGSKRPGGEARGRKDSNAGSGIDHGTML
ncbi:hypothetical protein [Ensifer soli]|uniref:hypothetical protein n=1 Tax=Ciceribacter sp. sgz301302 TaxID=3342379 RepID=UPI0035B900E8